ncbi:MAG: polysaccharide biosynthesis protein [Calditrichaeota bacterium]|nr:polysaccharide biosynthesis protein [Candidatus Cloacimonadota bacterium]MCA9785750.1 polysaccharide biosynthesis protein [Candidatus Cloacimonadota bacterium]MCB1048274.1 polysaccharide biosynthesis protein [Calditrichota bacterium]MCB9472467.1 polysaccharide biosynthesis protein [Candidatus Delongbacteria bacterium]
MINKLRVHRKWYILSMDVVLSCIAFYFAFLIIGLGEIPPERMPLFLQALCVMAGVRLLAYSVSNLYKGILRYASIDDLKNIFRATSTGTLLFLLATYIIAHGVLKIEVPEYLKWAVIADYILNIILIGGSRFMVRALRTYRPMDRSNVSRVVIVGAGDAGESILREIQFNPNMNYEVVGLLDDDRSKVYKQIHGIQVLGTSSDLAGVLSRNQVDQVLIAVPSAPADLIRRIVEQCRERNVQFRKLPGVRDLIHGNISLSQFKEVQLEDLLGRDPIKLDLPSIGRFITDRTVLVTGGAGSIGSELCRQVMNFAPRQLICLDHNENGLYYLMQEFSGRADLNNVVPVVGSITDPARIDWVFRTYRPEVVFHAAAHKHVPMMERNKREAVRNNILGTKILVNAAHEHKVGKFVMISTDKAVNPTSVMGVCKRVAELVVRDRARESETQFMTVRFGNVLGSAGSVVPLFRSQISRGGPITITHRDIERYFMTIFEAVQLVIQAAAIGQGGEIFVLDMGTPMKIIDLARNLITLSGLKVGIDIDIEEVGLRPGEKMSEELWVHNEKLIPTVHKKINIALAEEGAEQTVLNGNISQILEELDFKDDARIVADLKVLVPTFTPVAGDNKRY